MYKRIVLLFLILLIGISSSAQQHVVTSIAFEDIKKTNPRFLKQLMHTKENSVLDAEVLEEDMTRLVRLPAIAKASYTINKSQGNCVITIKLVENHTLIPILNFYQTNNEELAYLFGLYEHNFFKRSISLGAWYQKNIYDSFGVNFSAPYLFNSNLGLAVNFVNWSTEEPVFFESGTALYKYNNVSTEVLGLFQFNFNHKLSAGINFFTETYSTNETTIVGAPADFSVDKLLFKTVYTFDNLKYDYQYIEGLKSEFNLQYVTSPEEGNTNFIIGWNDLLYYKRIKNKGNWASRLRLGLSNNDETPFAPFAVDNNLNLRGVGIKIDRGTGVIILNTEYRHTIVENGWCAFQANVFIDAGSWRNPGGDFSDFTDNNNVRVFPGAGVRFIHKRIFNLVLRADFGYGITEDEPYGVVFGVGQYF